MRRLPKIAESEWVVMKILWERYPRTAAEVIDQLASDVAWSPRTVKTLLSRLVKKGALGFEQEGRGYRYFPKVTEDDCMRAERSSFVKRVYGGALTPMLTHLIEDEDLSKAEIAELKSLLDRKGRAGK